MKVYAIIVTYNGIKWIEECLKSLTKSSIAIETIIIDNNSSDDTVQFIKQNFEKAILFEQHANLGFGIANNIGISYALNNGADYVFLLNQDVFVEPGTIEKLVDTAKNNPDFGIVSPIHLNGKGDTLDESFQYYISRTSTEEFVSDAVMGNLKKSIYSLEMINAAAWFLPKKTFEIVGGFDPMFFLYGEDDNYCQRILFHNLKIGITPCGTVKHDSDNNFKKEFQIGSDRYFDKFLIGIKVKYANVNTDDYKKINPVKLYFLKQSVLGVLKLNFLQVEINWKKFKMILKLQFKENVIKNRQIDSNYLDYKTK